MLEALRGLVRIPSVTGQTGVQDEKYGYLPYGRDVFEALKYMLDLCESYGFRTKNCDNRVGWAEIGEGEELIGILAHLDVVPEGNGWDYPPFDLTEADGKVYGRGVADDKGPAMAAVWAMKQLLDSGVPLHSRIRIIFGCQEETGDWLDMEYYKEHEELPARGFTPDADFPAIYGEKGIIALRAFYPKEGSGITEAKGGNAVNMVADFAELKLESGRSIKTSGISAHGSLPEEGENAISKAMEQAADESSFAQLYMQKFGYYLNGEGLDMAFADEESGKLIMNVGTISTDDDRICMEINIRYPVTYSEEAMRKAVYEKFKAAGFETEIYEFMKPVFMDKDGDMIKTLVQTFNEITGMQEEPTVIGGGTYARAMENIVAFGPMIPGRPCTEHMKNENLLAEDLKLAAKIYETALRKLCCE